MHILCKKYNYKKSPEWIYEHQTKQTCLKKYNKTYYQGVSKYVYDGIQFDSAPEISVYIYAKNNNIDIERCPTTLEYYYNNKKCSTYPDFRYDGKLIEIKGGGLYKRMLIPNTKENEK